MKNIQIELPLFTGFYQGAHDGNMEVAEEQIMENYDFNNYDDFIKAYNIDYKAIHKEYSKDYTNEYISLFGEKIKKVTWINIIKFIKLTSPQYYNYSTDTIDVEVEVNQEELLAFINKAGVSFIQYIKGTNTSSDWFITYMPNNIEEYIKNIIEYPNRISQVIEYYLDSITFNEYDIIENIEVSEIFESNISSCQAK